MAKAPGILGETQSSPSSRGRTIDDCPRNRARFEPTPRPPQSPAADDGVWFSIETMVSRSDERDRGKIDHILEQCLNEPESIGPELATRCLLLGSIFFENIGDAQRALCVAAAGLKSSLLLPNRQIQRQAHNTIGVIQSRVYDFERACYHLELALSLAKQLEDDIAEFATLCNIVAVLMSMGLMKDAYALSLRLTRYPGGSGTLDSLHLQNAINGSKLAKFHNNLSDVKRFSKMAKLKLPTSGNVGGPWKAYVKANEALRFLLEGDLQRAATEIEAALRKSGGLRNIRVAVILADAQSAISLALGDRTAVEAARLRALSLLPQVERFPLHREDVLKMLIELYAFDSTDAESRRRCIEYWRLLNEQLVKVRYRNFYERMTSIGPELDPSCVKLAVPSYAMPLGLSLALTPPPARTVHQLANAPASPVVLVT